MIKPTPDCTAGYFVPFYYGPCMVDKAGCTNVPMRCGALLKNGKACEEVKWKYSMSAHWAEKHAGQEVQNTHVVGPIEKQYMSGVLGKKSREKRVEGGAGRGGKRARGK